jgi:hypothetical protein
VRTATATTITCRARGGGTFGTLPILVQVHGEFATGSVAVNGVLEIHSVDPAYGSLQGGTVVTIRGAGFAMDGSVFSTNFVSIGTFPAAPCRVLHASWDTIVCQTEPAGHMHTGAIPGEANPLEISVNGIYAQCLAKSAFWFYLPEIFCNPECMGWPDLPPMYLGALAPTKKEPEWTPMPSWSPLQPEYPDWVGNYGDSGWLGGYGQSMGDSALSPSGRYSESGAYGWYGGDGSWDWDGAEAPYSYPPKGSTSPVDNGYPNWQHCCNATVPMPEHEPLPFMGNHQEPGVQDQCAFFYTEHSTPVIHRYNSEMPVAGETLVIEGKLLDHPLTHVRTPSTHCTQQNAHFMLACTCEMLVPAGPLSADLIHNSTWPGIVAITLPC